MLANVRRLRLGEDPGDDYRQFNCSFHSTRAVELIRGMPRLEELHLFADGFDLNELFALPLANLRVLQMYHSPQVHRLHLLAENPQPHPPAHPPSPPLLVGERTAR